VSRERLRGMRDERAIDRCHLDGSGQWLCAACVLHVPHDRATAAATSIASLRLISLVHSRSHTPQEAFDRSSLIVIVIAPLRNTSCGYAVDAFPHDTTST
jgi:hypothetical protein